MEILKPKPFRNANKITRLKLLTTIENLKSRSEKEGILIVSSKFNSLIEAFVNIELISYGVIDELGKILNSLSSKITSLYAPIVENRIDKVIYLIENQNTLQPNENDSSIEGMSLYASFEKKSIRKMIEQLSMQKEEAYQARNKPLYEEIEDQIELLEIEYSQVDTNYQVFSNLYKTFSKFSLAQTNTNKIKQAERLSNKFNPEIYKKTLEEKTTSLEIIKGNHETFTKVENQEDAVQSKNLFNKKSSFDQRLEEELTKQKTSEISSKKSTKKIDKDS
jgi:hypothetical protein